MFFFLSALDCPKISAQVDESLRRLKRKKQRAKLPGISSDSDTAFSDNDGMLCQFNGAQ